MSTELIIYTIGYGLSAFLSLCASIFVLSRGPKKIVNISFFLTNLAFSTFAAAYLLALNTADPYLSRFYLLFTLSNIFTVCFNALLAFSMFDLLKKHKWGIVAVFVSGFALLGFFLTDTYRYMLPSRSYDFTLNFFHRGPFYWVFVTFFFIVDAYFFSTVAWVYFTAKDMIKRRATYFLFAFGWAYFFGSLGFLPIFDYHVNLMPTILLGLYSIPLAYGILKYDLIEIHILAKRAFLYAVGVILVGLGIIGINILNNILTTSVYKFSPLIIPLVSGLVLVGTARYIWGQLKLADTLKYEFINNISHKFRTPLTHIRWIAEELRSESDQEARNKDVDQIQYASMRLFELTNIVMDVAQNEVDDNFYRITPVNVQELIESLKENHKDQIEHKNLHIDILIGEHIPQIQADKTRLQFALQILFENALIYTPNGGRVQISVQADDKNLFIVVKDNGIGIDTKELPFMFSKFYRTSNARHTDTEGMGIGLYIAKNIITKHHGQLTVESEGLGKGSTFNVVLPIKN